MRIKTVEIIAVLNLYANFFKILDICNHVAQDLVSTKGKYHMFRGMPKCSSLKIHALSLTAENMDIDREYDLTTPNIPSHS